MVGSDSVHSVTENCLPNLASVRHSQVASMIAPGPISPNVPTSVISPLTPLALARNTPHPLSALLKVDLTIVHSNRSIRDYFNAAKRSATTKVEPPTYTMSSLSQSARAAS